jgi:hypothetical protein
MFLDYDRSKTMAAITMGSLIPLGMYIAWTFAVVGGGIDTLSVSLDGPLMTVFSMSPIAGSSVGCIMSLSEEFDTFLKPKKENNLKEVMTLPEDNEMLLLRVKDANNISNDKFSLPTCLALVGCSWMAAQYFAKDLNGALKVAGSFGSPLLYGVLPDVMAYTHATAKSTTCRTTNWLAQLWVGSTRWCVHGLCGK